MAHRTGSVALPPTECGLLPYCLDPGRWCYAQTPLPARVPLHLTERRLRVPYALLRWYRGRLRGQPASSVHLSVSGAHAYFGTVHTAANGTFALELPPSRRAADGGFPNIGRVDVTARTAAAPPCVVPPAVRLSNATAVLNRPLRARRAGQQRVDHVQCSLYLDADATFFREWGGEVGGSATFASRVAATLVKMIDVMYQVVALYGASANLGGSLQLHVRGATVHTELALQFAPTGSGGNTRSLGSKLLHAYQSWLAAGTSPAGVAQAVRGPSQPTAQEVCLNHLFTHTNLGGVIGVAIQASPEEDVVGGMCEVRGASEPMLPAATEPRHASSSFLTACTRTTPPLYHPTPTPLSL